jgi:hypothetical protein
MPTKKFSTPTFTISSHKRALRTPQEESLSTGTLGDYHWRALVRAWQARPDGVTPDGEWYSDYAAIRWTIWTYLRNYQGGALVEEYHTATSHRMRLTPRGERFYRDTWQHYHDLYPGIEASEPAGQLPSSE